MFTPIQPIKLTPPDDNGSPVTFPDTGDPLLNPGSLSRSWRQLRKSSCEVELTTTRITRNGTSRDVYVIAPKRPSRGFGVSHLSSGGMLSELQSMLVEPASLSMKNFGGTFADTFIVGDIAPDGTAAWWSPQTGVIWTLSLDAAQRLLAELSSTLPARWRWTNRLSASGKLPTHRPA